MSAQIASFSVSASHYHSIRGNKLLGRYGLKSSAKCIQQKFQTPGIMLPTNKEKPDLQARLVRSTRRRLSPTSALVSAPLGLQTEVLPCPSAGKGGETALPAARGAALPVHPGVSRGRLGVLANVIRKELEQIFCQFDSKLEAADEGVIYETFPLSDLPSCKTRIHAVVNNQVLHLQSDQCRSADVRH
ncbi:hypothetical protein CB1_000602033 [Camelus ferus]|nr:hypothetical protein CB1_000602033 [Camelus ferus]